VTWKQIFNYVLDPIGYTYVTDGSGPNAVILIKLKTDIASEPMETLVHLLDSAKAEDLAKSLTQFLDTTSKPPETIIPDSRTNSLIITAHPSKMSNILEAINRLDQATKQVYIEAKFIEVNANDDKNLGINWNFDNTPLGSVGYAYQYGVFEGLGALNNSGAMPGNVPEQTINGATASPTPSTNLNFLQPAAGIASNIPTPSRKALDLFLFNQAQYSAVLRALQQITSAKLVSNPTAITLDNKEVTLYSGTNITVVFPTINNQTGQAQAGNNTVYTVGITMKVLPHTTNGGLINLTLNPTLSRIDPVVDTYFGASSPRIDTRSLTNAEVSIKDGFTLAIGGLIDDQDSKATSAVPILSEIPVLGNLFKSTETIHQRNNLIIFVTARTLSAGGAALQETVSSDLMQRANVTADEIPGYYNAKRTVETPGMTYPSKDETKMLDDIQKLRDQAAQLQKMSEYQQKLMEAQSVLEEEKSAQPKGN
jgi:type IV pilus assembly protein PilQ